MDLEKSEADIAANLNNQAEAKVEGATGIVPFDVEDLWYLAHPYTAPDKRAEEANFRLCCARTAKLIDLGYYVYSPICHTHPIHMAWPKFLVDDERELWMKLDNLIIKNTNFKGIILAPNWETSKGCLAEREQFEEQHKDIRLYEDIVMPKEVAISQNCDKEKGE